MTEEKVDLFFSTAISKTKNRQLTWSRIIPAEWRSFNDLDVDSDRSFIAKYDSGRIALLCDEYDDYITCWVQPERNLSFQQIGSDDDTMLLRLYNIVYSQFPSIDSFVDDFISGAHPASDTEADE